MQIFTKKLNITTKGSNDLINITDQVQNILGQLDIQQGLVNIFVIGSTVAITCFEYEPGMISDMQDVYERIAAASKHYSHDETWNDANGFSHVRAAIQGSSTVIPFEKARLLLGTWQQVVLAEFDTRSRKREIVLTFIGQ
ncbi:MAG: secondary thiamine-phosphate synthase enzyme YjbQ [Candidatus Omnitrophota bacterium]